MKNNGRVSDHMKINSEVITVTSAAGSTSNAYDMGVCGQALFNICANGNFSTLTLDLMEATAATAAGSSAAGGSAGIVIGGPSTAIPITGGVRAMTLTLGTVTTAASTFSLMVGGVTKQFTYTTSTALNKSSAQSSTNLYFGSTVGSTVDTGLQLSLDALSTAITSTLGFGGIVTVSTPTTVTLKIALNDGATGNLGLASTATGIIAGEVNEAVGAFNIANDELSTGGNRYVKVKGSTASTSVKCGVTVIRTGMRLSGSTYPGKLST